MKPISRLGARAAGSKRYFTGKPCKFGHVSERIVSTGNCLECGRSDHNRDRKATWDSKNKAAISLRRKAKRRSHPEIGQAKYRRKAKQIIASVAAWRRANPKKVRAWRKKHSKKLVARVRRWRKANPEKKRAAHHNREARKRAAGGAHTGEDIIWLREKQKNKCAHSWCRASLADRYHLDHRIPVAKGGSNDRKNLQLLCVPCNLEKHAKDPIDFAQQNGLLL